MPFVAQRFSESETLAGTLLTTTAFCAALASPLWGALSDRIGRRRALVGSQLCSIAGYVVLATAGNLATVYLSRIAEGLGGGNLGVAQSAIADVADEASRPRAYAIASAAFGAGFVVGPLLGGLLVRFGFAVPFLVAAGLQTLNVALTLAFLHETHFPSARAPRHPLRALLATLRIPAVGSAIARQSLYVFAFTYLFTTFSLFLDRTLGVGPALASGLLGVAGAVGLCAQLFGTERLVTRLGLQRATLAAFALGIVAYAALGFVPGIIAFVAVVVAWAASGAILRPLLATVLADAAPEEARGALLGLGDALNNAALIFSPTIGAAIVGFAPRLLGVVPALALSVGFALTLRDRETPAA